MTQQNLALAIELGLKDSFSAQAKKAIQRFNPANYAGGWKQLGQNLDWAGEKLKKLAMGGAGLLAGAAAGAYAITTSAAQTGDALGKLAERTGLNVEELQEYQYAAKMAGVAQEQFSEAMEGFATRLGAAKAGTGKLAGQLNQVSPSLLKQLQATNSTAEAFEVYLSAIGRVPDAQKRLVLANAAFGAGATELVHLAAKGSAGIADLRKEARRYGVMTAEQVELSSELTDEQDRMMAAFNGVKLSIGAGLMPVFTQLFSMAGGYLVENREKIANWAREFGEKLPGRIAIAKDAVLGFIEGAKPFASFLLRMTEQTWLMEAAGAAVSVVIGGSLVNSIVGAFNSFRPLFALMRMSPLGLLAVAAWAVWEAFQHWDDIKKWAGAVVDYLGNKLNELLAWFGRVLSPVASFLGLDSMASFLEPYSKAGAADGVPAVAPGAPLPEVAPAAQIAASRMGAGAGVPANGTVRVQFENLPAGARVRPDAAASRTLELEVGRAMAF